jgi:undecaprenyl diphosphate synthase
MRLPRHLGIITDGNRRWASARGLDRREGYRHGVEPGLRLYAACRRLGIEQLSVYGFTKDDARRPSPQVEAFRRACVELAGRLWEEGADLRPVGDDAGAAFPFALRRPPAGGRSPRVNLLVNYGWEWDLEGLRGGRHRTWDIPGVDLVLRWGGGRRLSGFLPVQSVHADFFVLEQLWPDFEESHLDAALAWYARQDRARGG